MRAIVIRLALAALIVALSACAKYPVVSSPSASVPTMTEAAPAR